MLFFDLLGALLAGALAGTVIAIGGFIIYAMFMIHLWPTIRWWLNKLVDIPFLFYTNTCRSKESNHKKMMGSPDWTGKEVGIFGWFWNPFHNILRWNNRRVGQFQAGYEPWNKRRH